MEKIKQITEKVKCTFIKICDTIKNIKSEYKFYKGLWDDPRGKAAVKKAKEQAFYFWKKVKPKKIEGDIVFGANDPATTGKVIGAVASVYGIIPEKLQITPDFEEERLEGNLKVKGRIRCIHILVIIIKLIIDKNVRYIIKKFQAKEDLKNEQQ